MKKNVLFLTGGKSDEHEISLISTKCALDALDRSQFNPLVVGISKEGVWYLEEESTFYRGEVRADKISLNCDAPTVSLVPFVSKDGRGTLLAGNRSLSFDIVFPVLHGQYGEDGTLQGLLEMVGIPFVGSDCGSSYICMDKVLSKQLCAESDIRVADFVWLSSPKELKTKADAIQRLGAKLFVKPSRTGSSVGISRVTSPSELEKAVNLAFRYDTKVLVEKAIAGREIECAVLGLSGKAEVAEPGEIVPNKKIGWYSYEAKYLLDDGAECLAPAPMEKKLAEKVKAFALRVFDLLECDGLARVDLFLEASGEIYLNEVNTIPGFTPISMYPKMWQASGIAYRDLITKLIELGFNRSFPKR